MEVPRAEKRKIRNVSDELSQLLDLTAQNRDPLALAFFQGMGTFILVTFLSFEHKSIPKHLKI